MTSNTVKHLEFLQDIINRMNKNSFQLKGWTIAIVSALLALYASSSKVAYVIITLIPIIIFWCLDAYYLQQERKFRGIYNDIVAMKDLPVGIGDFEMPISRYTGGKYAWHSSLFSKTIASFYGAIAVLVLVVFVLTWNVV